MDDSTSEIEYDFPSVHSPKYDFPSVHSPNAVTWNSLMEGNKLNQPNGGQHDQPTTAVSSAQVAVAPSDQSTSTSLHKPTATGFEQPAQNNPDSSLEQEPKPVQEIRMRDAELNVRYNTPVAEVVEVTAGRPPAETLNAARSLPSAQMNPLSILKPTKPYQGEHGRPYVGLAPSPWTPYERDPKAAARNHRSFCETDEASRRRQDFHAGNKYQSTPPNPVYTEPTHVSYEGRFPWAWEVERGADANALIKPIGMSLTEQVRLCEEEDKRPKQGGSQDSNSIAPPAVQRTAPKANQSAVRPKSLSNNKPVSTSTSTISEAILKLRPNTKPEPMTTSTSSRSLLGSHPHLGQAPKPASIFTNSTLQPQSQSNNRAAPTSASSSSISLLRSVPISQLESRSIQTASVYKTLPPSSIPAKRLSRPDAATWKKQASNGSTLRLHPYLPPDQHAAHESAAKQPPPVRDQIVARITGVKRPSPFGDAGDEQERDQPSPEPCRRIGGTFTNIWAFVPRFFSAIYGLFHVRPQEIVAVETNSDGRKRRAVAQESLSNNTSLVPNTPEIPGKFPDPSVDSPPLEAARMQLGMAKFTQTETPPASRPNSTDDMRPSGLTSHGPPQLGRASGDTIDWRGKAPAPVNTTRTEMDVDTDMNDVPALSTNILDSNPQSPVAHTRLSELEEVKIHHSIERIKTQQQWLKITGHRNDFMTRQTYPYYKKRLEELDTDMEGGDAPPTTQMPQSGQHYGTLWRYKMLEKGGTIPEEVQRDNLEGKPRFDREDQVNSLIERAKKAAIAHKEVVDLEAAKAAELRKARLEEEKEQAFKAARKAEAAAQKSEEKLRIKKERKAREERRKVEEQAKFEERKKAEKALEALAISTDKSKLIPPLNPKWAHRLAEAMEVKNEAQVLATSVTGVNLTRRDLGRLLPPPPAPGTMRNSTAPWLNDEAVNAWLATIVTSKLEQAGYKRGVGTPPFVAFNSAWYTNYRNKGMTSIANWARRQKIAGTKLLTAERIFFPVNTGAHWILLIVSPRDRKLEVLDSAHGRAAGYFNAMREWLGMELGKDYNEDEWQEVKSSVSQPQLNMDDCGVFVCVNALASAKNRDFSDVETSDGMLDARRMICAVLINGGFSGDWEL